MTDNVIHVPPRRRRVHHKGMFGWVEYHPSTKSWTYTIKFQVTYKHEGEMPSEAAAVLEVKRAIDSIPMTSRTVRSIE